MGAEGNLHSWIVEACLASGERAPSRFVEELMTDERCAAFGPVHHVLAGAALLTCLRNAQGGSERERLADDLEAFAARAALAPGATCARWGVCGAAVSAGMAFAVAAGNEPLKAAGWSEGQRMVARMGLAIADAGAPRCCKRDVRIVADLAVQAFSEAFDVALERAPFAGPCVAVAKNKVCLEEACPYHG